MALVRTGPYDYLNPRREWLATMSEEILDPELPIVDAHHHLWAEPGNNYQLDEFAEDLASGHNVIATVFADCHYSYFTDGPLELWPVGETNRISEIADSCDARGIRARVCEGVVGNADLRLGHQVVPVLEAHISAANGRFRGIRQLALHNKHFPNGVIVRPGPERLYADPSFRVGLAKVAELGLTFDAAVYHTQHAEVYELACAVPQSTIVLGHFGGLLGVGPYQGKPSTFLEWRDGIQALAACPNIFLKLGGFGMVSSGFGYNTRIAAPSSEQLCNDWKPYFDVCIDAFSAKRCMFESNFPVDKGMFSYHVLWNCFKKLSSNVSPESKDYLFRKTASHVYRLGC